MKQLKPPPHPLMALPIDNEEAARGFFKDPVQQNAIRRRLAKDDGTSETHKLNRALEQIADACYRYKQARQYKQPSTAVDVKWYGTLKKAAAKLCALLEDGEAPTVSRLLIALAEEAEFKPDAPSENSEIETDEALEARQSRLYERGLVILNQQIKLLHWWQGAADQAADDVPIQEGRPSIERPHLDRSLVHELVDIWCTFHGKPFVAPKLQMDTTRSSEYYREDQRGALFVAVVLKEAGFDFSGLHTLRICELVRDERVKEWSKREADPDYSRKRENRRTSRYLPRVSLRRRRQPLADTD